MLSAPTIGIITALEHEYIAVKAVLSNAREEFPHGSRSIQRYLLGTVPAANGDTHVVAVLLLSGMGNNSAAIRATALLQQFPSVHSIIMVGIAGGIPYPDKVEDHVRLGDVVVSNQSGVVQYDLDKETLTATIPRNLPRPPSPFLLDGVRHLKAGALEGKRPWEHFIEEASQGFKPRVVRPKGTSDVLVSTTDPAVKLDHPSDPDRRTGKPRIFAGPIASANKLLKNPVKRDALRDQFGVKAVEMEASGIADATWEVEAGYLVVRGICDYCDSNKGDQWQTYAAVVAAAYTRALLEAIPTQTDAHSPDSSSSSMLSVLPGLGHSDFRPPVSAATSGDANSSEAKLTGMTAVDGRLLDRLVTRAPDQIKTSLWDLRDAMREGRIEHVAERLQSIKHDLEQLELALDEDVKADVLRFEAAFVLDTSGDVEAVEMILGRIQHESLRDDAKLRALVVRARLGSRVALDALLDREDTDLLTLRAAFHLDLGEAHECLELLVKVTPEDETYTDALRLRALACLIEQKPDLAVSYARKALERKPQWILNRHAVAISEYYNALAPAALPNRILEWPEPVELSQVKSGSESMRHLQRASDIFDGLTASATPGTDEAHSAEVWAMACVANDRERQHEAIARCRTLLSNTKGEPHAILWTITRGYDIDLAPHVRHIEELITNKNATIPHIITLVVAYHTGIAKRNAAKAVTLLKKPWVKRLFTGTVEERIWHFWHVRSLRAAGNPENALGAIQNINGAMSYLELRAEKANALRAIAVKTDAWDPVLDHLEESYTTTNEPSFLYMWCQVMASRREWTRVADRAVELVERCRTEDALWIAVSCAHNARRFDLCFDLLREHSDIFVDHQLPPDLVKVKITSMDALGMRQQAITEAEAVAMAEPTAANILQLMELYRRSGNRSALVHHAKRLLPTADLTASQALRAVTFVQQDDRALAKDLWKRALNQQDLPDPLLGTVWVLGIQLGCDADLRPLVHRIMALDKKELSGVQILPVADLPSIVRQQRTQQEDTTRMYMMGTTPVHMAASVWHRSLVSLYHDDLLARSDAPDPLRQLPLLARHGGRPSSSGFPDSKPPWRLHLDVTAILLAAHLDILDAVERAFGPIHVAPGLMEDLLEIRDNLDILQQSRQPLVDEIVKLQTKGKIHLAKATVTDTLPDASIASEMGDSWAGLYEQAHMADGDGLVVDYLPLQKGLDSVPPTLSNDVYEHVTDCRAVIQALGAMHAMSPEDCRAAIAKLPQDVPIDGQPPTLSPGASLFCRGNIPETLAEAGVLTEVCEHFNVFVEPDELARAHMWILDRERAQQSIQWLNELIDRISDGLSSSKGTYSFMTPGADTEGEVPTTMEGHRSLYSVMRFKGQPGDVVWVDDRFFTAYFQQDGGVPIVGVTDVLKALVAAGVLSESSYYARLTQLRAANVRFIPLDADEILFHLKRASVDKARNALVERDELVILRRYIAACLSHGNILQRPDVDEKIPNKDGETAFVLATKEAVVDALARLWEIDADDVACCVRADWLLRTMYLDLAGLNALVPIVKSNERPIAMAAISLARLLSPRLSRTVSTAANSQTPWQHYMTWLDERVLRGRLHQPHLIVAVAENLKSAFLGVFASGIAEGIDPELVAMGIYATINSFPTAIRHELREDVAFMNQIGFQITATYPVDGLEFPRDDFYRAAAYAIAGDNIPLKPTDSDTAITLYGGITGDGKPCIHFTNPVTGDDETLDDSEFGLLVADPLTREAVVRAHRWWFDCDDETLARILAKVASDGDSAERVAEAKLWWDTSVALHYANLERRLYKRENVQLGELLPPNGDGVLRHLRLAPDAGLHGSFGDVVESSADRLIREEGLVHAIERLNGLPIPLPAAVLAAIDKLTPRERRTLIKDMLPSCRTPLSRIHLAHILLRFSDESRAYSRLIQHVVTRLLSQEGDAELRAFLALLGWIDREYARRSDIPGWTVQVRLAIVWTHAERIFSILLATGASVQLLTQALEQPSPYLSDEILKRTRADWFDIAHPKRAEDAPVTFLLSGLSYALSAQADTFVSHAFQTLAILQPSATTSKPTVALLILDPEQADNHLGSFIGTPILDAFPSLRSPNVDDALTQESLHDVVAGAISTLERENDNTGAWSALYVIIGDLPPYSDIAERLLALLRELHLKDILARNEEAGTTALRLACLQTMHFDDPAVRDHLCNQLVAIASQWAQDCASLQNEERDRIMASRGLTLFTEAVHLSSASPSVPELLDHLTKLLGAIVDVWAALTPLYRTLVERLYEELPISEVSPIVRLLEVLRAMP